MSLLTSAARPGAHPHRARRSIAATAAAALMAGGLALLGGTSPAAAETSNKTLAGWGTRANLGIGLGEDVVLTKTPLNLNGSEAAVTSAAVGNSGSLLLTPAGVYTVGAAPYTGLGQTVAATDPTLISGTADVTAVASGLSGNLLLRQDGTVWAWGLNNNGQVGGTVGTNLYTPIKVEGLSDVTAIAAGSYTGLAVRSDGTLWAWGRAATLGSAAAVAAGNTGTPQQVNLPAGRTATKIAASAGGSVIPSHALALLDDGSVAAWGANTYGQIGNGATGTDVVTDPVVVLSPADLPEGVTVTDVAAGPTTSFALLSDGSHRAWGRGSQGGLGLGNGGADATTPTAPTAGTPAADHPAFAQLVANGATVLARTATGTVYGWGSLSGALFNTGSTSSASATYAFPYTGEAGTSGQNYTEIAQQVQGIAGAASLAVGAAGTQQIAFVDSTLVRAQGDDTNGTLSFLTQPLGTASSVKTVAFHASGASATITSVKVAAAGTSATQAPLDFAAYAPDLPYTAQQGTSFPISVRFTPSALGVRAATLVVKTAEGETRTVGLEGVGTELGTVGPKGDKGDKGDKGAAGKNGTVTFTARTSKATVKAGKTAKLTFTVKNGTTGTLLRTKGTVSASKKLKLSTSSKKFTVKAVKAGKTAKFRVKLKVGKKAKPGTHKVKVTWKVGGKKLTRTVRVTVRK